MSSAGQQQALITPPQLDPERPVEGYGAARGSKKGQKLRLGFLKVCNYSDFEVAEYLRQVRSRLMHDFNGLRPRGFRLGPHLYRSAVGWHAAHPEAPL